jgi:hypothetical protein
MAMRVRGLTRGQRGSPKVDEPGGRKPHGNGERKTVGRKGESVPRKKDGTNVEAVRAGRPVTQTTSGLKEGGYIHLHSRNKYTIA